MMISAPRSTASAHASSKRFSIARAVSSSASSANSSIGGLT